MGMEIKMEEQTTLGLLITAITLSLIALGIPIVGMTTGDAVNALDGYYICDVIGTDSMEKYARLSGTKYTAYPYEDSNVGRKYCKTVDDVKGTWHTLEEYGALVGLDPYDLLIVEPAVEPDQELLQGPEGPQGPQGIQGETGPQGPQGVSGSGGSSQSAGTVGAQWSCSQTECVRIN